MELFEFESWDSPEAAGVSSSGMIRLVNLSDSFVA